MQDLVEPRLIALIIAAPGLAILGWAGLTLLAWVGGREATLPFAQNLSDESRLVYVGVDISYGLIPIVAGFLVPLAITGNGTSPATFLFADAGAIAYTALYYVYLRRRVAALRVGRRSRVLSKPIGR